MSGYPIEATILYFIWSLHVHMVGHDAVQPDWVTECRECEERFLPKETMDTRGHRHEHPFEHGTDVTAEDYRKWVVVYECPNQRCDIQEIVYLDRENTSYEAYQSNKNNPTMWVEVLRGESRPA